MRVKNTEPVCKESIRSAHGVVPTSPCGIDVHNVASRRDDKLFEILSTCPAFKRYELSVDTLGEQSHGRCCARWLAHTHCGRRLVGEQVNGGEGVGTGGRGWEHAPGWDVSVVCGAQ